MEANQNPPQSFTAAFAAPGHKIAYTQEEAEALLKQINEQPERHMLIHDGMCYRLKRAWIEESQWQPGASCVMVEHEIDRPATWADWNSRQRDVFIAEKIFGYKTGSLDGEFHIFDNDPVFSLFRGIVPHYTTEMSAAWLVVEKMLEKAVFTCEVGAWENGSKYVVITIDRTPVQNEIRTTAETMPMAICLAALHVWGVEVES